MFDSIVITAANEAQARGYRAQTADDKRIMVVPDPGDRRVGSLGATVNVLRILGDAGIAKRRVLIVHSGGDARRTPGYAAMGKAFVPLRDGRPMFVHIVEAMERLPLPKMGGVVVVSGDVLPTFDYEAIDLSEKGVTGVAYPDGPDEARRHGVYVVNSLQFAVCSLQSDELKKTATCNLQTANSNLQPANCKLQTSNFNLQPANCKLQTSNFNLQPANCNLQTSNFNLQPANSNLQTANCKLQTTSYEVSAFLQKPQVEDGVHLIDTGVMFIDAATARKMTALPISGDIYEEFPKMLLGGFAPFHVNVVGDSCLVTRASCLVPCATCHEGENANQSTRSTKHDAPGTVFFHIGSTRELLDKLGDGRTYVDAVHCALKLAGENVVTNVPAGRFKKLVLKRGECFTCIPYGENNWLDLKYNIDDNFKSDGLWEKHNLGEIMKRVDYKRLLETRSGTRSLQFAVCSVQSGEKRAKKNCSLDNSKSEDTASCKLQTANYKQPTANCKLQTANSKPQTANCKLQTANCKSEDTANCKLQTANFKVTAPVRIDFAGGWSDTPPICNKEGGTVLNAAVTLDGEKPICVSVSPRRDKFVKIVSRDLGKRRLIKSAEELADHADPHDWCALVKSALAVTGFEFGSRGLDITISADLPKGSGMGTSSILGAATIAALLGRTDAAEIGELTLRLEQEMRTGGGWQDQFGGIVGGVKLLSSKPGQKQDIRVEKLDEEWLRDLLRKRGLLYFTGQKRMARNILRKVLAFYDENPHDFAKILVRSLKRDARAAADAISRHDADAFAAAVNGYWRDKKLLDPGSTNERVEEMIESIRPHASAVTLTGAGGGGFMFILAKSPAAAAAIRQTLTSTAPTTTARFYDFTLSSDGLTLERL